MAQITTEKQLETAVNSYYEELNSIQNELTRNTTLACEESCSFCCSLHITVKPYELHFLVEHIKSQPESVQKEYLATIDKNCLKIENATDEQLLTINFDCPFLRENSCSVYEKRPTSCRVAHSKSKELCEQAYFTPDITTPAEHIPDLINVSRTFEEQFEDDLGEYHDVSDYNMNMALREALNNPDWLQLFLSGEEVFSDDALSRI